jgi:hypothetical protein
MNTSRRCAVNVASSAHHPRIIRSSFTADRAG